MSKTTMMQYTLGTYTFNRGELPRESSNESNKIRRQQMSLAVAMKAMMP
jgi:hypothetical protein